MMMTRFMQEISGVLDREVAERQNKPNDHYWETNAKKNVEYCVNEANSNATVDDMGVIRWKSNNRCLMDDFCEILEYANYPFSRTNTAEARHIEVQKDIEEMRKNTHKPSEEELCEMRNAFGEGVTIVNVLTGQKYKL